jgi:hypothetical protein
MQVIFRGFLTFILFQTLYFAETETRPYDSMTSISATLDVPPSIKEVKALGARLRTASTRLQPAIWEVFFSSCVHRFHRDLYLSKSTKILENQARFYEKFSRTSPSSLGFYYLVRFHLSVRGKNWFVAQNQGIQVIQSAFVAEMSPPDMEYFLFTLNQVASQTKLPLPGDVRISVEDWFRPTLSQLLRASFDFYLLKTENPQWKLQLQNLDNLRNRTNARPPALVRSIWGTQSFPKGFPTKPELAESKQIPTYAQGVPSKFYTHLFESFAWLQKYEPVVQTIAEPVVPSQRLRRRRQRRRQSSEKKLRLSLLGTGEISIVSKSILKAHKAQKLAQTKLQAYMAYIHLAYLYKLEEKTLESVHALEESLKAHPTSGTYQKLAKYYRGVGNYKRMNQLNNKAQALNPEISPVRGPEPRIIRKKKN